MDLAYYPGCSLTSTSAAYDSSVRAVCEALQISLHEIDDWNCCGATEAATFHRTAAHALVARNLALVDPQATDVVAPCAACYLNLRKTDKTMAAHADVRSAVNAALAAGGLSYTPGRLKIRHMLDVFHTDVGLDTLKKSVQQPLYNLRVAPYYGCQVVRPTSDVDDPEHPQKLDQILSALGADVIDYPLKSHCCGGHMTQISDELSNELIRRLLHNAAEYKADVIACMCPMCQLNLDAYQDRVNAAFDTDYAIPIVFFTQLIGLALGLKPASLGFGKELIAAKPVIDQKLSKGPDGDGPKTKRRRGTRELPMPTAE